MTEKKLTYRTAGVDVEANNEANERIKRHVRRTHNERVLTRAGLFGGALSLRGLEAGFPRGQLTGAVGYCSASGEPHAQRARRVLAECRVKLSSSTRPLAFLDYLAAGRLSPSAAEELVRGFARELAGSSPAGEAVPLIGGETAEMPSTFQPGAWEVVGALFGLDPEGAGSGGAELQRLGALAHPALVFTMDGVGTKTRLAVEARRTAGLALDIVHHSLNDILCQGGEGLALLFYLGCHRAEPALVEPLLESLQRACGDLGLALLEAAVAEKPGLYAPGEYDVCASLAGTVDAGSLLQGSEVTEGDLLLGLASSGLHTNGYSLARGALFGGGGLRMTDTPPGLRSTLGEALLAPHRNYARALLPVLRDPFLGSAIHAVAHVTGGGLAGNLVRVLPPGLKAEIRRSSWEPPVLFRIIQQAGGIPDSDPENSGMYEAFNMGIGLVVVLEPGRGESVRARLEAAGERAWVIGTVHRQPGGGPGSRVPAPARVELSP